MPRLLRYLLCLALLLAAVVAVRHWCIGSYKLATDAMRGTVESGDFVLVDKLHSTSNPGRNRTVLFRFGAPPTIPSALLLGRCVAMPGDTVTLTAAGYAVNGQPVGRPSTTADGQQTYRIRKHVKESLLETLRQLHIPCRELSEDSLTLTLRLTPDEETALRSSLPQVVDLQPVRIDEPVYAFVVPAAGMSCHIDSALLTVYAPAIRAETGSTIDLREGRPYGNGQPMVRYHFARNYYWILADNDTDAVDSRHLGLIPAHAIIGNVWFCWYSTDATRRFRHIR